MGCCKSCGASVGVLLLVVGVLFLLRDLQVWNFWNIQWWTVVFLLAGLMYIGCSTCRECGSCCTPEKKTSSKKKK